MIATAVECVYYYTKPKMPNKVISLDNIIQDSVRKYISTKRIDELSDKEKIQDEIASIVSSINGVSCYHVSIERCDGKQN